MYLPKFSVSGSNRKIEFTNCELSTEKTEGNIIAVNEKFLAMILKSENEIGIVDSSKSMNIKKDQPCLKYKSKFLDLKFSPFDNNILASSTFDKPVLLWKIPEEGLSNNNNIENTAYNKHTSKVYFIDFNPILSDVICTSTVNGEIHIWNIDKKEPFAEFKTASYPTSISWNPIGELIGVTTFNKSINFFDPRNTKKIVEQKVSEKSSKFAWIDNTMFTTISWNNNGNRLLKLWDMKKIDKEISSIIIDNSTHITTPFVNPILNIIYTVGKEENFIHLYDYSEYKEGLLKSLMKFNTMYFSNCSVLYGKKGLDKKKLEIERFARYSKTEKKIYYTSFFMKEQFIYDNYFQNSKNEENKVNHGGWIQEDKNIRKESNNNGIEKKIKTEEGKLNKQMKKKK